MAFSLSGLTSLFANPGLQAIGAGLLSGVVGGTALVATGVIPVGGAGEPAGSIELLACPDTGPALARISDGSRLLVTGRNADGTWLEVYIGQPGIDRAWTPATSLDLQESGDGLPVVDCAAPTPGPLPTLAPPPSPTPSASPTPGPSPSPTVTAIATATATLPPGATATPTPRATPSKTPTPTASKTPTPTASKTPTPPPPTPTPQAPTPTPDTTGPSISNLAITGAIDCGGAYPGQLCIFYPPPSGCQPPYSATISMTATDPSGVIDANLWMRQAGAPQGSFTSVAMNQNGNTWSGTIDAQNGWTAGEIDYIWEAFDSHGNKSTLNPNAPILRLGTCIF